MKRIQFVTVSTPNSSTTSENEQRFILLRTDCLVSRCSAKWKRDNIGCKTMCCYSSHPITAGLYALCILFSLWSLSYSTISSLGSINMTNCPVSISQLIQYLLIIISFFISYPYAVSYHKKCMTSAILYATEIWPLAMCDSLNFDHLAETTHLFKHIFLNIANLPLN